MNFWKNKYFILNFLFVVLVVFILLYRSIAPDSDLLRDESYTRDRLGDQNRLDDTRMKISKYSSSEQSRFRNALSKDPEAVKEALSEAIDAQDLTEEISKLCKEACFVAKSTGDFDQIWNLFHAVDQDERYRIAILLQSVFSKFGPEYDIPKKLSLLEGLADTKESLANLEKSLYEAEGRERYDEMQKAGIVGELKPEQFAAVIRSVGGVRLGKAFERINDGGTEEARRMAAQALGRYAMRAGPMAGSEEIAKLQPGIIRDEAVAEMVIWMNNTGSKAEAAPWLATIQDPAAKARATPKPKAKPKPKATKGSNDGKNVDVTKPTPEGAK